MFPLDGFDWFGLKMRQRRMLPQLARTYWAQSQERWVLSAVSRAISQKNVWGIGNVPGKRQAHLSLIYRKSFPILICIKLQQKSNTWNNQKDFRQNFAKRINKKIKKQWTLTKFLPHQKTNNNSKRNPPITNTTRVRKWWRRKHKKWTIRNPIKTFIESTPGKKRIKSVQYQIPR